MLQAQERKQFLQSKISTQKKKKFLLFWKQLAKVMIKKQSITKIEET